MPLAPQARRTWGTRYDSLIDTHSSTQPGMAPRDISSMSLHLRGKPPGRDSPYIATLTDAEKERSSLAHHQGASTMSFSTPDLPPQTRMPHEASVFVASLPSSLPEHELHCRLTDYLVQFATIKHVKLIKDNRNAVCAFVQVESANEATALIAACNFSMFMGRQIRCERARAFRTLLISWRPAEEATGHGHPSPLRLRRCRNTRYIQVTTDSDALVDDPPFLHNFLPPRLDDILSGTGAFFPEGLKRDNIQGLKALLEAFGPLEFMEPFDPAVHIQARPTEADVKPDLPEEARSASLSNALIKSPASGVVDMWAAKWEHRNDAVAAIQALQYIPSLQISWLHTYGRPSPAEQLPYRSQQGLGGGATPVREGERCVGPRTGPRNSMHREREGKSPVSFNDNDFPPLGKNQPNGQNLSREGSHSERHKGGPWSGKRSSGFIRSNAPSPSPSPSDGLHPLDTDKKAVLPHPGETSDTNGTPLTPDLISGVGSSPITPLFPATPVFPNTTEYTSTQDISSGKVLDDGRKAANPQIHHPDGIHHPAMDVRMVTNMSVPPIEKDVRPPSLPLKPTSAAMPAPPSSNGVYQQHNGNGLGSRSGYHRYSEYDIDVGQNVTLDFKELFVGGLNPETWSEDRVRSHFEQYGVIREVRFIKPSNNAAPYKRAFAFIRFDDVDGPQRAIAAQHLRIYDGHSIKVQLRDSQSPFRRSQWAYRSRGNRFTQERSSGHSSRGASVFSGENAVDGFAGSGGVGSQRGGSVHPPSFKPTMRRLSAPADTNGSPRRDIIAELTAREVERLARIQFGGDEESGPAASPAASTGSAPMEVGNSSAETSFSASESPEITLITSPVVPFSVMGVQGVTQSEPDIVTAPSSSNGDARSNYPPSPPESAPPSSATFYGQPQAWPYGMPPGPYGPYGYYSPPVPIPVPGQSAPDGSNSYWMMSMYPRPYVPWFNPPPGVELAPPPVRPSGFLQRDAGGILIPVYSPDRLGQYASPNREQGQPGAGLSNWQSIPPHPHMYPVPVAMPPPPPQQLQSYTSQAQSQQHGQSNVSRGWIHAQAPPTEVHPSPSQQGGHSVAPAYTHASTSAIPYPTNFYYPAQAPPYPYRQANYVNHTDHSTPNGGGQHTTTHVKGGNRRGDSAHRGVSGGGRQHYKRHGGSTSTSNNVHGNTETQWPKPTSALPAQLTMAAPHWP